MQTTTDLLLLELHDKYSQGIHAYSHKEYEKARTCFSDVLTLTQDPDWMNVHFFLAKSYMHLDQEEKGVEHFVKYLKWVDSQADKNSEIRTNCFEANFYLGSYCINQNHKLGLSAAYYYFQQALQYDNEHPMTLLQCAMTCMRLAEQNLSHPSENPFARQLPISFQYLNKAFQYLLTLQEQSPTLEHTLALRDLYIQYIALLNKLRKPHLPSLFEYHQDSLGVEIPPDLTKEEIFTAFEQRVDSLIPRYSHIIETLSQKIAHLDKPKSMQQAQPEEQTDSAGLRLC